MNIIPGNYFVALTGCEGSVLYFCTNFTYADVWLKLLLLIVRQLCRAVFPTENSIIIFVFPIIICFSMFWPHIKYITDIYAHVKIGKSIVRNFKHNKAQTKLNAVVSCLVRAYTGATIYKSFGRKSIIKVIIK